jgi:hypothetical protein
MTNGLCVDDHLLGFSAKPYTVVGLKHYETRTRRTHIRGRIAVHAGKKKIKGKEADRLYMDVLLAGKENELADEFRRIAEYIEINTTDTAEAG